RRLHCGIYVRHAPLRDVRKFFSGRRVIGLEIFSFQRSATLAANKMSESALAGIEPEQGFLGVFWRRPVFHRPEFFDNAHLSVLIPFAVASRVRMLPTLRHWVAMFCRIATGYMK